MLDLQPAVSKHGGVRLEAIALDPNMDGD